MKYICPVAFTFFGLFFSIVGVFMSYKTYILMNSPSEKTEGTVVNFVRGDKASVAPVFEYQIKNGWRLRYESHYYTSPSRYQKGDKVGLYYQIGNVEKVYFDSFSENWAFPLGFLLLGSLILYFGVYMFIYIIKDIDSQKMTTETEPQVNF